MAVDYTPFGDPDITFAMLRNIQLFFAEDGMLGLIQNAASLGAMIGLIVIVYQAIFSQRLELQNLFVGMLIYFSLVVPQVEVHVRDKSNGALVGIATVPAGIAYPASIISQVSGTLAYAFKKVLNPGMEYNVTEALRALSSIREVVMQDDFNALFKSSEANYAGQNLKNYLIQCMAKDLDDPAIRAKKLPDLLKREMQAALAPTVEDRHFLNYIHTDGTIDNNLNCGQVWDALDNNWLNDDAVQARILETAARQVLEISGAAANTGIGAIYNNLLEPLLRTGGDAANFVNLIVGYRYLQEMSNNEYLYPTAAANAKMVVDAEEMRNVTTATGAVLFGELVWKYATIIEVLAYSIFPFLTLFLFVGSGGAAFTSFIFIIAWVALWAPLEAILDSFIGTALTIKGAYLADSAYEALSIGQMLDAYYGLSRWLSVGNALMVAVPFISFYLVKQGQVTANSLMGSISGGEATSARMGAPDGKFDIGSYAAGQGEGAGAVVTGSEVQNALTFGQAGNTNVGGQSNLQGTKQVNTGGSGTVAVNSLAGDSRGNGVVVGADLSNSGANSNASGTIETATAGTGATESEAQNTYWGGALGGSSFRSSSAKKPSRTNNNPSEGATPPSGDAATDAVQSAASAVDATGGSLSAPSGTNPGATGEGSGASRLASLLDKGGAPGKIAAAVASALQAGITNNNVTGESKNTGDHRTDHDSTSTSNSETLAGKIGRNAHAGMVQSDTVTKNTQNQDGYNTSAGISALAQSSNALSASLGQASSISPERLQSTLVSQMQNNTSKADAMRALIEQANPELAQGLYTPISDKPSNGELRRQAHSLSEAAMQLFGDGFQSINNATQAVAAAAQNPTQENQAAATNALQSAKQGFDSMDTILGMAYPSYDGARSRSETGGFGTNLARGGEALFNTLNNVREAFTGANSALQMMQAPGDVDPRAASIDQLQTAFSDALAQHGLDQAQIENILGNKSNDSILANTLEMKERLGIENMDDAIARAPDLLKGLVDMQQASDSPHNEAGAIVDQEYPTGDARSSGQAERQKMYDSFDPDSGGITGAIENGVEAAATSVWSLLSGDSGPVGMTNVFGGGGTSPGNPSTSWDPTPITSDTITYGGRQLNDDGSPIPNNTIESINSFDDIEYPLPEQLETTEPALRSNGNQPEVSDNVRSDSGDGQNNKA
ncbi:MAG: hypothetical protein C9356_15635 [Oleiphilus sp.]|nr:MAG: hypothetical protein C9356_15635 [Oleiphilus sp.]